MYAAPPCLHTLLHSAVTNNYPSLTAPPPHIISADVVKGELTHQDSLGNAEALPAGAKAERTGVFTSAVVAETPHA